MFYTVTDAFRYILLQTYKKIFQSIFKYHTLYEIIIEPCSGNPISQNFHKKNLENRK